MNLDSTSGATNAIQILSLSEAQRLTQRIRLIASSVREGLWKLRNLVEEAKHSNVWQMLGYASWTAYLADTLGAEPMRLGRDERQELVGYLSGEGMSTRAIAPIVAVDQKTVVNDLRRGEENSSPEMADIVDPATGEVIPLAFVNSTEGEFEVALAAARRESDLSQENVAAHLEAVTSSKPVMGLDGKEYTAKQTRRRSSLVDDARNAGWQIRKAAERVQRIDSDDRFARNRVEILAALRPHIDYAIEIYTQLLELDQREEQ